MFSLNTSMLTEILKLPFYSGSFFSSLIAVYLLRMGAIRDMTFLNKMFLIYFVFESIIGLVEGTFLFRLRKERYEEKTWPDVSNTNPLNRPQDQQIKNCANFITVWMLSFGSRCFFHCCLIFCRFLQKLKIVKLPLISQLNSAQLKWAKITSEMSEEIVLIFGMHYHHPPTIILFWHTKSEDLL